MSHVRSVNTWILERLSPSLAVFAKDIKFSHTIFAMPFAAAALFLIPISKIEVGDLFLLLGCMVCARSFAMGFNRFVDAQIDARNMRTAGRAIPSGKLTQNEAMFWIATFAGFFCLFSFGLNPLAGYLSVPLLGVLGLYSFQKHLGWFCHWYLGFCLGLAPVGVSVALTGQVSVDILVLALAIALWTGGFDVIYATQDLEFDRTQGLRSVPVKFGLFWAIWLSRLSFIGFLVALAVVGALNGFGLVYYLGVGAIAAVLFWEHYLVRDILDHGKSNNMNAAFFNANAMVSIVYFLVLFAEIKL